jgi:hypothetical protein
MKLLLFFIVIPLSIIVYGQDCKLLNNFTAFHGFKFGSTFPDSLKKYSEEIPNSNFDKSFFSLLSYLKMFHILKVK